MNRSKTIAVAVLAAAVLTGRTVVIHAYTLAAYHWASWPVAFYVNPANGDVSASAATSAIQAGMNVWNTQSGTAFRFSYAGQVSDTSTSMDGRNVIIFRNTSNPDSPAAVATTYAWSKNGSRYDTDIVFWDGQYKFFTGSSGCAYTNGQYGAYIEDIATHELGHALGLQHSTDTSATMYATYTQCSTSFRTLSPDDIAGVQALYPADSTADSAPSISIASPTTGTSVAQGTALTFDGSASDSKDGPLTSKIAWSSSIDGALGTGSGFSKALSAGSHVITAKVTDSGGKSASQAVSVNVTAAPTNTAPTVSITSPATGTSVAQGTSMTFNGTASDTQDGVITAKLAWSSSIDGSIGTGSGFTKALSAGSHVITAKVTDAGGLSASKQVSVTITAPADPVAPTSSAKLNAMGYKVKGSENVDLFWTNLPASTVDVYRNGAKIMSVGNSNRVTDKINSKGAGTYTYKVCGGGTSTCSNQASVSF